MKGDLIINMKNALLTVFHTILILLAWTSPFWLDWKIISIFIILYYIQIFIFNACILTKAQFKKEKDITMYAYYAELLGFKVNRKKIKFTADYIMPWIILLLSLVWQILLNHSVLIQIW